MKANTKFLLGILTIVLVITAVLLFLRHMNIVEFFTSSPISCRFVTLGRYKLTTVAPTTAAPLANGYIYIKPLSTTPVTSDWRNITHTNSGDTSYTYTDFAPLDLSGINVKSMINSVMTCQKVPEYSNAIGINTSPALILCLESYTPAVGTNSAVLSRVFFVKCFVPSASGANVIVGEILNNTADNHYVNGALPVDVIQGRVGVPIVSATTTYTLSYTICAGGNRPEGFSYTDCCSSVSQTTPITTNTYSAAIDGICKPTSSGNKSIGDSCVSGTECSSGTCRNSVCVTSSSTGGKPQGQSCSENGDCDTGLACSENICKVKQTYYCSRNPNGYDPDYGTPCRNQIGAYSGDSEGRWQNMDWGTEDEDDKYDAEYWWWLTHKDRNSDEEEYEDEYEDEDKDDKYSTHNTRAYERWLERLDNSSSNNDSNYNNSNESDDWSGYGNRWRGSSKDMSDQVENIRPQRFSNSIVDATTMQPSLATCNKYYTCTKQSETYDESCEGFSVKK